MKKPRLRLKFSPMVIAIAVIALASIGHAALIARVVQGQESHDSLVADVESAELTLSRFKSVPELQNELAEAQQELGEARSIIPEQVGSTPSIESLLELSDTASMEVLYVKSEIGDNENVGDHTYNKLVIQLTSRGSLDELITFLDSIENGGVTSARVDELAIVGLTQYAGAESQAAGQSKTSVYQQFELTTDMTVSVLSRNDA